MGIGIHVIVPGHTAASHCVHSGLAQRAQNKCHFSVRSVFNQNLYKWTNSITSTWGYVYYIINAYI